MVVPQDVLRSISTLKRNANFVYFIEWLQELNTRNLQSLPVEKDVILARWRQGRIQQLNELFDIIEKAPQ